METLNILSKSSKPEDKQTEKENSIPKFASFRPDDDPCHGRADNREERKHKTTECEGPPYRNSRRSRHQSCNDGETRRGRATGRPDSLDLSKADAQRSQCAGAMYVADKYGDPKILTYGSIDRFLVSNYFRFGGGSIMGLSQGQRIDRSVSNESSLVVCLGQSIQSNPYAKDTLRTTLPPRLKSQELEVQPSSTKDASFDVIANFVPLKTTSPKEGKRTGSGLERPRLPLEDHNGHYMSVDGKGKASERLGDGDLRYRRERLPSEDGHLQSHFLDRSLKGPRQELSRQVDGDPWDINACLGLISSYDAAPDQVTIKSVERHGNASVKISIYEKALTHVGDSMARERLFLGLMQEASMIWDTGKLSSKWRDILKANPGFHRLWAQYLDFQQTASLGLNYEGVAKVFLESLEILQHAIGQNTADCSEHSKLYDIYVYIILRMTFMMREAGFAEHAVATWQALLEFEFFIPDRLYTNDSKASLQSQHTVISVFEEFWDSEVPRIGEEGSKGWAYFDANDGEPPAPKRDIASQDESDPETFAVWIYSERLRALFSREPARTIDDVEGIDPYRVILFSDILPVLLTLPTPPGREALLNAFLIFCHLPPYRLGVARGSPSLWWLDGFLRDQLIYQDLERGNGPFDLSMWNYRLDLDTLFAPSNNWFTPFASSQYPNEKEYTESVKPAWTLLSLKSLTAVNVDNDDFLLYCLAFELTFSPSTVRKTARSLLKKRPSSLTLYNAYALLEYRLDNATKGGDVITTALNMSKQLNETAQRESIVLWRTQIWELLEMGKTTDASQCLLSYTDEHLLSGCLDVLPSERSDVQGVLTLRVEKALSATRDYLLSHSLLKLATTAAECLVLLTYFRDPSTLAVAVTVFHSNLNLFRTAVSTDDSSQEWLHQSFARLIYHHATHTNIVKPAEIRCLLAKSVATFPQNTIFLSLYAWNETRFRIDDRVRSIVRDIVLGSGIESSAGKNLIAHFFAIHTELCRGTAFGSNANATRASFERAVESQAGAHCAGLWKTYFRFEHSMGGMQKAKSVFYRGVRACPWVKEMHMLAFEFLGAADGGMNDAELRGVYELLLGKGLRVYVSLGKRSTRSENGQRHTWKEVRGRKCL